MKARHLILPSGLGLSAILMAVPITKLLAIHISHGGSWWWTSALLIPGVVALTGIALAVRVDNVAEKAKWRTYEQQEAEARDRARVAAAWRAGVEALTPQHGAPFRDHPLAMSGKPAVLTEAHTAREDR